MKVEELIISELANNLKLRLVGNVIRKLQKEPIKFLGEEFIDCIKSSWEEYCISIQDKTFSKELKEKIDQYVREFFIKEFDFLKEFEKVSLWIKTKEGISWLYENKGLSINLEQVPFNPKDYQESFMEMISKEAKAFENENIYEYINLDCGVFQESYDDDGKLEVYE